MQVNGFRVSYSGGIYPRHEFDMGGGDFPPINLSFFGNFFCGFENLITLSVILRHLEAELSILRCLKLIRGLFPHLKKFYFKFFFSPPLIFFWQKPWYYIPYLLFVYLVAELLRA
jgi:hypothetical protein